MSYNKKSNSKSYLIILLSLAIVFFFTKSYFYEYETSKQELNLVKEEKLNLESELGDLSKIEERLKTQDPVLINKLSKWFNEKDLVNYLYLSVEDNDVWVLIKNINLSKWSKNKYWINHWSIWLSIFTRSQKDLLNYIDKLQNDENWYYFYIDSISFDYWSKKVQKWFSIDLNINYLYK